MHIENHSNFRHLKWRYKTPIITFIIEELVNVVKIHNMCCKMRKIEKEFRESALDHSSEESNHYTGTATMVRKIAMPTFSEMGTNRCNDVNHSKISILKF